MCCIFLGIPGQSLKCLEVKEFVSQLEVAAHWSLFNRASNLQSQFSERTFVFKTFYNYLLLRFLDTITFDNQFRDFASYFGRQAKSGLEVFLFFSDCQIEP